MNTFSPLSLDDALKLVSAFSSATFCPIGDKTLHNGEISPKCFSGRQLADFLRSDQAGSMKASLIHYSFLRVK